MSDEKQFTPEQRKAYGRAWFHHVMHVPKPVTERPYDEAGISNFVFGEMWCRPGLSRRDRRLITLACVGAADTVVPITAHVYAAMKSGDVTLDQMNEFVLQFAVYMGWPKASIMQQTVLDQWARIEKEGGIESIPEPKREDFLK